MDKVNLKDHEKLRELRKSTTLNQDKFSKLMLCNYQTYVKWEQGANPVPSYILLLAEYVSAEHQPVYKEF